MTDLKLDFFDVDKLIHYLDENLFRSEYSNEDRVFLGNFESRMPGRFNVVDYFNRRFRDKEVDVRGLYEVIHSPLLRKLAMINVEKGVFNPHDHEPERYEKLRLRFHRNYKMSNGLVIPRGGVIRIEKDEIWDNPIRRDVDPRSDYFFNCDLSNKFPTEWFLK